MAWRTTHITRGMHTPGWCRALPGLNSAAVGLIVTSVFQLTLSAFKSSPFPNASISIGEPQAPLGLPGGSAAPGLPFVNPLVPVAS